MRPQKKHSQISFISTLKVTKKITGWFERMEQAEVRSSVSTALKF